MTLVTCCRDRDGICKVIFSGDPMPSKPDLDELSRQVSEVPLDCDLVVDLSNVKQDAEHWLGALITLFRSTSAASYKFVAFGPTESFREKLKISRIDSLFKVVETEDEALAEVSI